MTRNELFYQRCDEALDGWTWDLTDDEIRTTTAELVLCWLQSFVDNAPADDPWSEVTEEEVEAIAAHVARRCKEATR